MNTFFGKHYHKIVLATVLLFLGVNIPVLGDLYRKWYAQDLTGPYAHGLLVAAIVVYMVVRKIIASRSSLEPAPSILGILLLVVSQLVMFLAKLADINFIQYLAVISTLLCLIWATYSFRYARQFIIPSVLMLFTLPVWGVIEPPLQEISIFMTNAVLTMAGIPYYLEGTYFHFASGVIQIAPECAGMQQMLVSMIIGLLFSEQHHLRLRDTVKTLVYLAIAAIMINTIRIIIVMVVGYYTKMESSLITKHLLLGWIIYGIGIFGFLYFYSGRRFLHGVSELKNNIRTMEPGIFNGRFYTLFTLLVFLTLFPTVANHALISKASNYKVKDVDFRQKDARWQMLSQQILINWHPDYPRGDARYTATFSKDGNDVYVYINTYKRIKDDIDPVNMDNTVYNRSNWRLRDRSLSVFTTPNAGSVAVNLDTVDSNTSQPLLILSFYVIDGHVTVNLAKAKLYTMFGLLRGRYEIKQVALATVIQQGEVVKTASNRLKTFFSTMQLD